MSTLEQRIVDVIEAIASEFKKRDAITTSNASNNSGIDEKTLNRIMRCVHAWEKSVDTDGDGLKDYDEYELYGTNPDKLDTDDDNHSDNDEVRLRTDPNDASSPPVQYIKVKRFFKSPTKHRIEFQLIKNDIPVYWNQVSAILKSGSAQLSVQTTGITLQYIGPAFDTYELSVLSEDITITKTYNFVGGRLVEA